MSEARWPLEDSPTGEQKERLQLLLEQLAVICLSHRMAIIEHDGDLLIVDTKAGSTVGIGLTWLMDKETSRWTVDATGSILDGVWPVVHEGHVIEQRLAQHRDRQSRHAGGHGGGRA